MVKLVKLIPVLSPILLQFLFVSVVFAIDFTPDKTVQSAYHAVALSEEAYYAMRDKYTTDYKSLTTSSGLVLDPNIEYSSGIELFQNPANNEPCFKFELQHKTQPIRYAYNSCGKQSASTIPPLKSTEIELQKTKIADEEVQSACRAIALSEEMNHARNDKYTSDYKSLTNSGLVFDPNVVYSSGIELYKDPNSNEPCYKFELQHKTQPIRYAYDSCAQSPVKKITALKLQTSEANLEKSQDLNNDEVMNVKHPTLKAGVYKECIDGNIQNCITEEDEYIITLFRFYNGFSGYFFSRSEFGETSIEAFKWKLDGTTLYLTSKLPNSESILPPSTLTLNGDVLSTNQLSFQDSYVFVQDKKLDEFDNDYKSFLACPTKDISVNTTEGVYKEIDCYPYCYATIVTNNNEELSIRLSSEEEATSFFGNQFDKTVSVNYITRQLWERETCHQDNFIISGNVIENNDSTKSIELTVPKDIATSNDSVPCPEKTLNSGTIEGVFLGTECVDYCHTTIRLDSGEEINYLAGGEVQEYAGEIGTRVVLTFDNVQFYMDEAEECVVTEVLQTIKPTSKR